MSASVQDRLIALLRGKLGLYLPEGVRLTRVNASRAQRVQGAWAWRAETADGMPIYAAGGTLGSQWNMQQVLSAKALFVSDPDRSYDVHVDVIDPAPPRPKLS